MTVQHVTLSYRLLKEIQIFPPTHSISRAKRFRPFDYACLSVELLQSSAVDCIVRYSRPYSPLQWTVQSAGGDCNNLPFKKPWLTIRNGLLFRKDTKKRHPQYGHLFLVLIFSLSP